MSNVIVQMMIAQVVTKVELYQLDWERIMERIGYQKYRLLRLLNVLNIWTFNSKAIQTVTA